MAPQAIAGPDYDTALNYYKQKQYEKAAVHFETASLRAPGNISANYYAAYCFHLVGKRQEAIQSYRRLCKNFPGTKAAAIKAVFSGGASPHRLSLSETLLVFPEHRAFLRAEASCATIVRLRRLWPERAVVVEVDSESEARRWIDAGADILQLEKTPLEMLRTIAAYATSSRPTTRIAAAGGIDAGNAATYAEAGAHILVTSAPYFAHPRDVAVTLHAGY